MKLGFNAVACVPIRRLEANVAYAKALQLPKPTEILGRPPLAVVGGGPSIDKYAKELKAWKGDVWACGSAFIWCRKHRIEATFFSVDPLPEMVQSAKGAKKAILATTSHPTLFEAIPEVEAFDLVCSPNYVNFGNTAATATPCLALEMGYRKIVYYGCESSFDRRTHAYKNEFGGAGVQGTAIWVRCGDMVYPSRPDLLLQVEMLAEVIRTCTKVFKEKSGGLLRALIKHKEFDVVAANEAMHKMLNFECNGQPATREQAVAALPVLEIA